MGRLNVCDLPRPAPRYQITRQPAPPKRKMVFEKPPFCGKEDAKRAPWLRKYAHAAPHLYKARQARRLARKLANKQCKLANTAASSLFMGDFRWRLIGALWKLVAEGQWDPAGVTFFTARPKELEFRARALKRKSARKFMKLLRTRLNRAGAADADGWLVAFLHGEFEPTSGRYVLHFHGFAAGGMVDVLERLRGTRDAPGWLYGGRLNRSRKPITNLAYVLGYGFKAFWPCKRIGPVGDDGKIKRNRFVARIPEPYHSQYLIWLDQQSVADMTLLMKLQVTRSGLQPTNQIGRAHV